MPKSGRFLSQRRYVRCDSMPVCCACQDPSTIYCSFSLGPAQAEAGIGVDESRGSGVHSRWQKPRTMVGAQAGCHAIREKSRAICGREQGRRVVHWGCIRRGRRRAIWDAFCGEFPQDGGQWSVQAASRVECTADSGAGRYFFDGRLFSIQEVPQRPKPHHWNIREQQG